MNNRCLYENTFKGFINEDINAIKAVFNDDFHGPIPTQSREAWDEEIRILKNVIYKYKDNDGKIIFEYEIPRLGKRIDAVLLYKGIIFCLEFKVGESQILENDIDQVFDYALDLKYFHKYSQNNIIAPILIATKSDRSTKDIIISDYDDLVLNPLVTGEEDLSIVIENVINKYPNQSSINEKWTISPYSPTPTIIEAARVLYEKHTVKDITRHEADDSTTDKTIDYILDVINTSKLNHQKSICFVTGVPGAGKTLVGLEVAIKQTYSGEAEKKDDGAVYLSGNGPLVAVLTEALALDNVKKCKGKKLTDSRREVKKFIQMIHRYRDTMLAKIKNPVENGILEIDPTKAVKEDESGYAEVDHIAIFDEAQRSWTHSRLENYLKRGGTYGNKIKIPNFPMSESEFLIWSLDQREDWATIVCLVGGGQEINTGEAGISEWIRAVNDSFPNWKVYISPKLIDKEYAEGNVNELLKDNNNVTYSDCLHLSVSMRSFRAEKLSQFVNSVLSINNDAGVLYNEIKDKYPIVLTRDIDKAKQWLHGQARASEKTGVLITKESARYKPLGIHVLPTGDENAVHWFLEDKKDTRSSNYLEDAATEIQVQGLELDYACILWDADMRFENGKWKYYRFDGKTKWIEITADSESKADHVKYMLNAYRVLLTRARLGMVICIPSGNSNIDKYGYLEDETRNPEYYDGTYEYLKKIGIKEII